MMAITFGGFYVAGMAICDQKIALLILQTGEMETCAIRTGVLISWPVDTRSSTEMITVGNQEQISSSDFDLVYNMKSLLLWIILVPNIRDIHEKLR